MLTYAKQTVLLLFFVTLSSASSAEAQELPLALRVRIADAVNDELKAVRTVFPSSSLRLSSRDARVSVAEIQGSAGSRDWVKDKNTTLRLSIDAVRLQDSLAQVTIFRYLPNNASDSTDAVIRYLLVQRGSGWFVKRHSIPSNRLIRPY